MFTFLYLARVFTYFVCVCVRRDDNEENARANFVYVRAAAAVYVNWIEWI